MKKRKALKPLWLDIFGKKKNKRKYHSREQITNQLLISKLKKVVESDKLFLNPLLDLNTLVDILGTNRTYLATALKSTETSYKQYINTLRIDNLVSFLEEGNTEYGDAEEMARQFGFHSRRQMDQALKDTIGESFYQIKKRNTKKEDKYKK